MITSNQPSLTTAHAVANPDSLRGQKPLVVCALAAVPDIVTSTKASALVSVLHADLIPETPKSIDPEEHFKLAIDDIEAPHAGLKHAELKHIEALCQFAQAWHTKTSTAGSQPETNTNYEPQSGALVIHCYAGISRSTATAFVLLCALNPDLEELTIAKYLRAASPTAAPNRLIVRLGDEILGRRGRMTKAIRSIDRSLSYEHARPFALQSKFKFTRKRLFLGPRAA